MFTKLVNVLILKMSVLINDLFFRGVKGIDHRSTNITSNMHDNNSNVKNFFQKL